MKRSAKIEDLPGGICLSWNSEEVTLDIDDSNISLVFPVATELTELITALIEARDALAAGKAPILPAPTGSPTGLTSGGYVNVAAYTGVRVVDTDGDTWNKGPGTLWRLAGGGVTVSDKTLAELDRQYGPLHPMA